jgi:hypothetical protein
MSATGGVGKAALLSRLPRKTLLTLLLATIIAFSVGVAVGQITSFTVVKPYLVQISTTTPKLQVNAISLTYDASANQYLSASVTVANTDAANPHSGTVHVVLKDASGVTIASGSQSTDSIAASSSASITVSLSWTSGKTVADVTSGLVSVEQTA